MESKPTIQLLKAYRARDNPRTRAVPFNIVDDYVEVTLNLNGVLETAAMLVSEFIEHFELVDSD